MDGETLAFASNRARGVTLLEPGAFGPSNHLPDTPWPKVTSGKAEMERLGAGGSGAVCQDGNLRVRAGGTMTPSG